MAKPRGMAVVVATMLSLFLLALTIKEFKSIPYVGRDVAAVNTISVSGKGESYAAPDIATFSFTVQEEKMVVSDAQKVVDEKIASIISFLKKNGVEDKDIKTQGYNIYPRYEYPEIRCLVYPCPQGKQTLAGYDVSQSVQVKIRTLADAGRIIGGVGGLGVTDVSGLTFSIDKEDAVLRAARQKAIDDAQTKAKELAHDLGVTLVRIVNFSESGNYPVPMMYAAKSADGGGASETAQLPAGENQFISNITITYEIR